MNSSTEMKFQKIDELLEARSRLIEIQTELGMDVGIHGFNNVLVLEDDLFLELADHNGKGIERGFVASGGDIEFYFKYKDIMFNTFVTQERMAPFIKRERPQEDVSA